MCQEFVCIWETSIQLVKEYISSFHAVASLHSVSVKSIRCEGTTDPSTFWQFQMLFGMLFPRINGGEQNSALIFTILCTAKFWLQHTKYVVCTKDEPSLKHPSFPTTLNTNATECMSKRPSLGREESLSFVKEIPKHLAIVDLLSWGRDANSKLDWWKQIEYCT